MYFLINARWNLLIEILLSKKLNFIILGFVINNKRFYLVLVSMPRIINLFKFYHISKWFKLFELVNSK
jgi:hypothetical protein